MNFRNRRGEAPGTFGPGWNGRATFGRDRYPDRQMAESQLSELQNARVFLEKACDPSNPATADAAGADRPDSAA